MFEFDSVVSILSYDYIIHHLEMFLACDNYNQLGLYLTNRNFTVLILKSASIYKLAPNLR
jgi:hypothetical protein